MAAVVVHFPLLLMKLPLKSYDTNFHIFFASHYFHHWFDPWNQRWYAGFSQTTYPPLPQQWVALISPHFRFRFGVHGCAVRRHSAAGGGRLPVFAAVDEPASRVHCGISERVLGSESFLVYSAGQLATTCAAPIYLNALPFLFEWVRHGNRRAFLKGSLLFIAAAAAHHATLLFGSILLRGTGSGSALILDQVDGQRISIGTFVARTMAIVLIGRRGGRHRAASVLDRADSLSGHADADSASEPRELHPEPAVGSQLLHRSVWSFDPGSAIYFYSRLETCAA